MEQTHVKASDYDLLLKLVLVGDSGVGNSSILARFCKDTFSTTTNANIGVDFYIKTVEIEGKKIKLLMWDTAGQERFRYIVRTYFRNAEGIVIVYDVTNEESFDSIRRSWIEDIEKLAPTNVEKMILGNKCDREGLRVVTMERGRQLAEELGAMFMEVSAKSGLNLQAAFMAFATNIKMKMEKKRHFRLYIAEARDLLEEDIIHSCDPYVIVSFVNATVVDPVKGYKTSTINRTLTPKWNEELSFLVIGTEFSVILDVMNGNILMKDAFLGRQILYFNFYDRNTETDLQVVNHHLRCSQDMLLEGRKCELTLLDKYSPDLIKSHTDLRHVRELSEHFTVERQKRDYSHRDNRGDLMVYYAFEEEQPSSCMAAAQHQTAGGKNASAERPEVYQLMKLEGKEGRTVKVVEGVAAEWEQLAYTLRFSPAVVRTVERDAKDCTAACVEVLYRWVSGAEGTRQPVSWATLIKCLRDCDFVMLARDLENALSEH